MPRHITMSDVDVPGGVASLDPVSGLIPTAILPVEIPGGIPKLDPITGRLPESVLPASTITGDGIARITVGADAPKTPQVGDLWIDTSP